MKNKAKISSGIFLLLALIALIVLAFPESNTNQKFEIKKVEITGNKYLSANIYAGYTRTETEEELNGLNLSEIKDRFEKHPYVKYADVLYTSEGTVRVTLHEKNFKAIVLLNGGQYLADEELNIVPLMPFTNNIDLPVVENVKGLTVRSSKRNAELKKALKIIFAAKFLDESLFNAISEVDMNNGGGIKIRFANDDYSLLLGRENEIRKIAYFDVLFENLNKVQSKGILKYIDLRFKDEICLGFRNTASFDAGRKI